MADQVPAAIQGFGSVRVQLVDTLLNPETPTLAEVKLVSSLNATPYFRADAFQIAHEQGKIDDTRLSDDAKREQLGISSYNIDKLVYVHDPQATTGGAGIGNKLYDKAAPGTTKFLIVRYGVKSGTDFAVGQRIAVFYISFGEQHQPIPVGEDSTHLIEQPVTVSRVTGSYTLTAGA